MALATGGIVTAPTIARLGEYGPEAVIPLTGGNARGGFGSTYNIVVNAGVGDPGSIGQKVVETIKAYERRNGNSWRQ
jgi:SLT domain-containing protein